MIEFYNLKGEFVKEEELTRKHIDHVNGMKIRCTVKDGVTVIGFCRVAQILTGEFLEISRSFDSHSGFGDVQKIHWTEIEKIEAILYSNPRWGTRVDFTFDVDKTRIAKPMEKADIPEFLKH